MRTNITALSVLTIFGICLVAAFVAFTAETKAQKAEHGSAAADSVPAVTPVEPKYVCMINNQYFTTEQIPVAVGEKTYYGCCAMCEAKLKSDPASRTAVDPVSGGEVDKAASVIGAAPDGKVYYFESEENLKAYNDKLNSGN